MLYCFLSRPVRVTSECIGMRGEEAGEKKWRAVWIELGLGRIESEEEEFKEEEEHCWKIFEKDYVPDLGDALPDWSDWD